MPGALQHSARPASALRRCRRLAAARRSAVCFFARPLPPCIGLRGPPRLAASPRPLRRRSQRRLPAAPVRRLLPRRAAARRWPLRSAARPPLGRQLAATARGEQAWHRRARRLRQSARALVALGAAQRRLAAHHGGGGGGIAAAIMPQRRGGGGGRDNGGGTDSVLRQGLRDLLRQVDRAAQSEREEARGAAGGARGGSRGRELLARGGSSRDASAGGRGGAGGSNRPPQPGDWTCRSCQFAPNFSRRRDCFRCGRTRSPRGVGKSNTGGGSGHITRGPVGAGGLRPMLGGRAASSNGASADVKAKEKAPTFRVPGASVAARASSHAGGDTWASIARQPTRPNDASPPSAPPTNNDTTHKPADVGSGDDGIDDEGFQVVTRRNNRGAGTTKHNGGYDAKTDTARRRDDDDERQDTGVENEHGDDDGDGEGDVGQPTVAELQRAWHTEIALVKKLRQQGLPDGHPVMRAACESRDAAEQAWRGSKEPAPASVRLGRAQSKLDRAVSLQADARRAILDAEAEHRDRMATLQATMDQCTERVRLRRRQLSEVQGEVGAAGGANGGSVQRAQQEAIRHVHSTICEEVGPTIAALVEQIDTDAPAWSTLNSVLGKLSASKATLEEACQPRHATRYNIGEGSDQCDARSEWSESHELGGQPWGDGDGWIGYDHDGDDTGHRHHDQQGEGRQGDAAHDDRDQSMGTGDWWDAPSRRWGGGARWQACGHGQWARTSWADQFEEEHGDSITDGGQPAPARRRLDDAVDGQDAGDAWGAQRHRGTGGATMAGATATSTATDDDPEERKRKHGARVDHIISMAVDAGVNPLTSSGEELHMLDPHQLDAWVAEQFPAALLC